ncbi:MAG: NEW3 domain-containing protein [Solirubrobacteraceae bacterium]
MSHLRAARRVAAAFALVLVMLASVAASSSAAAPRSAGAGGSYNGLALTPPMGYNDWSYFQCNVDQNTILAQARALVSTGLAARGYDTVTIDDCWPAMTRDANGNLQADPTTFPNGMAYIGRQLHAMGLKFGIYEDAGTQTCGGYPGSWGHYTQDAEQLAGWGVDYVKLDGCNVPSVAGQSAAQTYEKAYAAFSAALRATGRPIVFSASAPAYFQGTSQWFNVIRSVSKDSNLWREGDDIPLGQETGAQKWQGILTNYGYNVGLGRFAGPGHWNDPDFLIVGDSGLTTDEMQSQMTLWAEMAAPLNTSTDVTNLSPAALQILSNKAIIAVDQDPLGVQGHVVKSGPGYNVLTKPLSGGDASVVLFNKGDQAQTIKTSASAAGLPKAAAYELTNLVTGQSTETAGAIAASVPAHGTVIYRVRPGGPAGLPSAAAVSFTHSAIVPGKPSPVTAVVTNDGRTPIEQGTIGLTVPSGWTVSPATRSLGHIAAGATATGRFTVVAPSPPPGLTANTLTATADYVSAGRHATATGELSVITNIPYPSLASAFNNVAVVDDSNPTVGDFDGSGDSYSAQALAAVGVSPGVAVTSNGATFSWPTAGVGTQDNVQSEGQAIDLSGSGSKVAFLGSEAGFSSAPVTVTYTDGSTTTATLGFPNWCCAATNTYGASPAIISHYRDTPTGPADQGTDYDVFYNSVGIDASKTVATVTLPSDADIHIFAMTVQQ